MTLFAGWLEKRDWEVTFRVIDPQEAERIASSWSGDGGRVKAGDPGVGELFKEGLALVTQQELPEGANLLLTLRSPFRPAALTIGAENLRTESLPWPDRYRSNLKVFSIREGPLDPGPGLA